MTAKRGICMVTDPETELVGVVTNGDLNRLVEKNGTFPNSRGRCDESIAKNGANGTLAYTVKNGKIPDHA